MTDTPELLRAHHLKTLKLPTFLREYDKLARQCAAEGLVHVRFLARLVELELIDRERRMIERRIKAAKFPAVKSLPSQACCACPAGQRISFDFKAIPALNKMQVLELARCEWIDRRENVIALGPGGTGKTHVALGLGLAVCQKGLSVGFITAAALVHELMEARDERRPLRLQKQMANCKLLIIDELGFVPLSKTGAEVLFELISQRYERGATLITSNLPFDEWTETFGSERLTGALLDRLTHHVNILEMNGDSYRLAQSRGRKGIAINQGQDRLALAGQSAQAPASYIESAGTWAPSAFLVPDSGTLKWPTFAPPHGRLSCMRFAANAVRLQLHALAYNPANFLRTLATPSEIETWSLTSLRERLIKTGARLVRHGRYAIFQMAEAALPRQVFAGILGLINGLRDPPAATGCT